MTDEHDSTIPADGAGSADRQGPDPRGAVEPCPTCGAAVPADAPGGLCPRCLLAGAESGDAEGATLAATGTAAGAAWGAPEIGRVRAAFPQLEVLELIGCGGMGAVFKARQPRLDRLVALKILPERLADSPAFTERFTREGRALARLAHPNIVAVHDFGECGGFHYLLMEFVDGVNLRQAMRTGRFTPGQALAIVPEICAALQFAHEHGVLHRDIKPENILLDARGAVKIADFGIAKILGEGGGTGLTLTQGSAAGTPQYMAPEQIERPREVDHRADIYSLGVVFYELLTGELPLGRFAPPSNKTPLDARVDAIVLRALEKEKELRQQSAREMRTEIETVTGSPPPVPSAVASGNDPGPILDAPCFLSTPEHARSFTGRFLWIHRAKGRLTLDAERLRFAHHWNALDIPLRSIVRLGIGEYAGKWPVPVRYLAITSRGTDGTEKTTLLTPHRTPLAPAWEGNRLVDRWNQSILRAMARAGLPEPAPVPAELRVVSRMSGWARVGGAAILMAVVLTAFQSLKTGRAPTAWRFAEDFVPLVVVLVGMLLGGVLVAYLMRRSAHANPDAPGFPDTPTIRHASAAPIILVVLGLVLPFAALFPLRSMRIATAQGQVEIAQLEATHAALGARALAQRRLAEDAPTREDSELARREAESLEGEQGRIGRALMARRDQAVGAPATAFRAQMAGVAFLALAAAFVIGGTIAGWRELARLRTVPPPRPGLGWPMTAALIVPVLAAWLGVFLLIYLPLEAGQWGPHRRFVLGAGVSLSIIAGLAAAIWLIRGTARWVRGAVPPAPIPAPSPVSGVAMSRPPVAVNPWPRRIFWLAFAVLLGIPMLIGVGLIVPMLNRQTAATSSGRTAPPHEGPKAAHRGADGWSVYSVTEGDHTAYVLMAAADFSSSSRSTSNNRTGAWVDDGTLTFADGSTVGFRREQLYPDELYLNGRPFQLAEGRVFLLAPSALPRQLALDPPLVTEASTADLVTMVRDHLDAESGRPAPNVERQ